MRYGIWMIGWFGSCMMAGIYCDSLQQLLLVDIFLSMMYWTGR